MTFGGIRRHIDGNGKSLEEFGGRLVKFEGIRRHTDGNGKSLEEFGDVR